MAYDFQLTVGDLGIDLTAVLKSDVSGVQTAVDFSTYQSATFSMWTSTGTMKVDAASATFSDAANGEVTYAWSAGDVNEGGNYRAKFVCVNSAGEEITFPRAVPGYFTIKIWDEAE